MLSTYYMVKLFKKATKERQKQNHEESKENRSYTSSSQIESIYNKCRICLREGSIPIFSAKGDISREVCTFGHIEITESDDYPKHLCESCHKLLQAAILFRKTAKQSARILNSVIVLNKTTDTPKPPPPPPPETVCKPKEQKVKETLLHKYFIPLPDDYDSSDESKSNKPIKKKSRVQCKTCFKIITKSYYKEHYNLHDPAAPKLVCDICGKSFLQKATYSNHYSTHNTNFPYKCQLCPYKGKQKALLKTHMRRHWGDYKYMCTECPSRFVTKSNLNIHMLKHKEPMFKCDTCNRAYHSKLYLQRHFEVDHLGIKNHVCNLCGKEFGYRKAMNRHQIDVHKREKKLSRRTAPYIGVKPVQ